MLQPIVLSGGSGSRLWPLSREQQPKQLLKLFGEFSMLQSTILRLNDFSGDLPISRKPIVVCNQSYRFITAEQLQEIKVSGTVMLEPFARNTAPALTVAAIQTIATGNPDTLMLVMPADHLIEDEVAFHAAITIGIKRAAEGALVCFGVVPNKPDVGYGYIKMDRAESSSGAYPLISFVEKPDAKTAQEYLDTVDYVWNSGIFLMKAQVWLDAVEKLNPKMHKACRAAVEASKIDSDFLRIDEAEFEACPDDSIDYAVMGHAGFGNKHGLTAYVVPMNVGWSDVGVWDASEKDANGNATRGKGSAVFHESTNCMAHAASKRLVTVLGLEDVVVNDTADAVMMVHRLENPGKFPLKMIEVQSGSYLGEDDIVRLEDVYGRVEAAAT
jgi:mannose-1-phosphate guanylyltransferase / mannose-6-phosphate isomerase